MTSPKGCTAAGGRMNRTYRTWTAICILGLSLAAAAAAKKESQYLEAAFGAEKWIAGTAVAGPSGIAWPADPKDPKSVGTTLYAGSPGVILFYLELYAATEDRSFLQKARRGADHLVAGLRKEKSMGLYEGMAGVAFALRETYKTSHDQRYQDAFLECLKRIQGEANPAGAGVEWSGTTDIISGSAGIGLLLLYAAAELKDETCLDLASRAGSRLIELGRPENGGLKWPMDPGFAQLMPNFSHGTAGVCYFLATLYERTKRKEFLDAALAGARYLLSVAKTDGDSCLIFHHEPDGRDLYYLGWCHGPAGTARLFYRLFKATGERAWLDWLTRSARGILASGVPEKQTPGLWNNDGLCCGLAGIGDFFLSLYRVTHDKTDLDFCRRVARELLARATNDAAGTRWIQAEHRTRPDLLIAQTGLMQGAAGIGIFLLHLDALENGRSVGIEFPDSPFLAASTKLPSGASRK